MNRESLSEANKQVKALVGLSGLAIGRAAAMAWMVFGSGESKHILHIQCSFRIRDGEEILVSNLEMFYPSEKALEQPEYDPDSFDWDVQGDNRYDEWVGNIDPAYLEKTRVLDAEVNTWGDLAIILDQGIVIEVFINEAYDECWRLFKKSSDHFVMTGRGIEDNLDEE